MRRALKQATSGVLRLLARASRGPAEGWQRLWAHARLGAAMDSPLDASVVVLGVVEVHGSGRIRLGRRLHLYRALYFETQESGTIEIGDDVVLSRGVHVVAFAGIRIGAGSMVGEYSSLRDANHRIGGTAPVRHSGHDAAPIHIGRNVWIGRGVTVLPGVTIGDGAVVGANAVVTHDVPAGGIAVGVPARPLARRVAA